MRGQTGAPAAARTHSLRRTGRAAASWAGPGSAVGMYSEKLRAIRLSVRADGCSGLHVPANVSTAPSAAILALNG